MSDRAASLQLFTVAGCSILYRGQYVAYEFGNWIKAYSCIVYAFYGYWHPFALGDLAPWLNDFDSFAALGRTKVYKPGSSTAKEVSLRLYNYIPRLTRLTRHRTRVPL